MKLTADQSQKLKKKYNGHCAYCGDVLTDKWQKDHFKPVVRVKRYILDENGNRIRKGLSDYKTRMVMENPENDCYENMVPACPTCNNKKSSMDIEGFRRVIGHTLWTINNGKQYASYQHAKRFGLVVETDIKVVFYYEKFGALQ